MTTVRNLCQYMASDQRIMTFSDLAHAAANGVAASRDNPVFGALLGVSLEAGKRAVQMTRDLMRDQMQDGKKMLATDTNSESKKPATISSPLPKTEPPKRRGPKPRARA